MALKLTDISELGPATFAGDVTIADSKKLYLGGGNDLRIYHVADSNSYIEEHGAGALVFKSNDFYFQSTASATALQITPGGAVTATGKYKTLVSSGAMLSTGAHDDAFGYNTTSGKGHYIKGTGSTYIYGGGKFYDGSATYDLIHSGGGQTIGGTIAMANNGFTGVGSVTLNNGFTLSQGGSNYATINSWIYLATNTGLYAPGNSAHIYPNTTSDYGAWRIDGARNSWNGITFAGSSSTFNTLMSHSNGSVMGLYNDTDNEWYVEAARNGAVTLYHDGSGKLSTVAAGINITGSVVVNAVGDSGLSIVDGGTNAIQIYGNTGDELYLGSNGASKMRIYSGGAIEATVGDFRAPIFYDTNNTDFYTDPLSTSVMWGIKDDHGNEYISKYLSLIHI